VTCWAREGGPGECHEGEEDSGSEGPGHGNSLAGDGVCRTPETQTGPGFGRGLCLHYSSSDHGIVHRGRVAAIGLWDSFVSACRSVKERSNRARFMRGLLRPGFIEDDGGETCPWRPLCLACLMQAGTLHNEDSVDGVQLASHVRTSVRTVICLAFITSSMMGGGSPTSVSTLLPAEGLSRGFFCSPVNIA
jgi:hypothetical protein